MMPPPSLPAPQTIRARSALAVVLVSAACTQQAAPPSVVAQNGDGVEAPKYDHAKALGLTPWHADFPFETTLSPRVPGRWYDRSKRQALSQIVANLQGNCTQSAWQFARLFFENAAPGAAEVLVDAAEANFTAPGLSAFLENLADAMGRTKDEFAAPTLLRLASHPNTAVATRAVAAMMTCGNPETLRLAEQKLAGINLRAQADWLRAVARKAPQDVEAVFSRYLAAPQYSPGSLLAILEECAKLPGEQAVRLVERLADARSSTVDTAMAAAAIMHRAGDRRGTARLREFLRGDNPQLKATAVKALAGPGLELVLDDVLTLSIYEDPEVRLAVAEVLSTASGDPVDETLTTLGADVATPVRQVALRALVSRGKRYHLDQLIARVRSGSGTNLSTALHDISASGDPQALGVIYERYKTVPTDEKRSYMQALAYSRAPAVFAFLAEIFLGKEEVIGSSGITTISSAALLMANIEGALPRVVELFGKVKPDDYRRRAQLLRSAANFAGFLEDTALRQPAIELFGTVWSNRSEAPQLRLYALTQHRRYLTLDDAMQLKANLEGESEPMRWALSDFLFEFF